jgi:predicted nuclease of predicted toxin-antitoxin system
LKILADENIPLLTVDALVKSGHDVLSLHEPIHKGLKDKPLWALAQTGCRLLITTDKGFARYRDEDHFGILIIRLKKPSLQKIHDRVLAALSQVAENEWPGLLITMRDAAKSQWKKK